MLVGDRVGNAGGAAGRTSEDPQDAGGREEMPEDRRSEQAVRCCMRVRLLRPRVIKAMKGFKK